MSKKSIRNNSKPHQKKSNFERLKKWCAQNPNSGIKPEQVKLTSVLEFTASIQPFGLKTKDKKSLKAVIKF